MSESRPAAVNVAAIRSRNSLASAYYELTKPRITLMVVVTMAAGFYLALPMGLLSAEYGLLFIATLLGTTLLSAGSCVLNHVMEHVYDRDMRRTMFRPIPSGKVRASHAAWYGIALAVAGLGVLFSVKVLTAALGLLTLLLYLLVYTPMKRRTQFATLVGGIPGALPPAAGYATVAGTVTTESVALFLILFLWQMPHFLSLAWMYRKDYERGGFPMITVMDRTGITVARHIISYILLLLPVSLLPTLLGATGVVYFIVAALLGTVFLVAGFRFMYQRSNVAARNVLLTSYFYLLALFTVMFFDKA